MDPRIVGKAEKTSSVNLGAFEAENQSTCVPVFLFFKYMPIFMGCFTLQGTNTYPTLGKGKQSTQQCQTGGDMLVPRRVQIK